MKRRLILSVEGGLPGCRISHPRNILVYLKTQDWWNWEKFFLIVLPPWFLQADQTESKGKKASNKSCESESVRFEEVKDCSTFVCFPKTISCIFMPFSCRERHNFLAESF